MRRSYIIFVSLWISVLFSEKVDPFLGRSHVLLDLEYVYLKRAPNIHNKGNLVQLEDTSLVQGVDTPNGLDCSRTTFRTIDLLKKQGYAPGARITLDYLATRKSTWQGRFLGFLHWSGFESASCPGSLEFPFKSGFNNTFDYHDADTIEGRCDTRFWSAEANYWYHVTPRRVNCFSVSWVFGLRSLGLNEHFLLTSEAEDSTSHYTIKTKNIISGPQLGGDFEGNLGSNFTWGVSAKTGALVNFAENKTLFKDDNDTLVLKNYNPSDFNVTFLGEIAPFILFNLSKKVLFKASYELIYLSNIALAMNQITFQEDAVSDIRNRVNIGGFFMCYGAFVGLGFDF